MILEVLSGQFRLSDVIVWLAALILAISIHEFAHAWAAWKLGDPTARLSGRLTLNPKAHLDKWGTLLLLLTGFGWGKPVPINPSNFNDPVKDSAITSLAGPASNIILALILGLITRINHALLPLSLPIIGISLRLGIFNLLPIDPLDGFKIIRGVLPKSLETVWLGLGRFGTLFLIFILLPIDGGSILEKLTFPLINKFLLLLM